MLELAERHGVAGIPPTVDAVADWYRFLAVYHAAVTWVPNLNEGLLPVAGIYGPNASGKSNILAALQWFQKAVRDSLRAWDDDIPVEPFALGGIGKRPTRMTTEAVVDGVRYEYTVELDEAAVRYEALFHYPEHRRRRVFEREGEELTLQRGLGAVSGTRELLTPRTLALDECWCLFDVEWSKNHPHLKRAVALAAEHGVRVAVSNPCFELWLILHFENHTAHISTEDAERRSRHLDGREGKRIDPSRYIWCCGLRCCVPGVGRGPSDSARGGRDRR